MRKLVVPSWFGAGVFCLRGVGDGEREREGRLRVVRGVACAVLPPGVRRVSPRLVGDWPILAKAVISGISEKALKQVSSILVVSGCCCTDSRKSSPA